MPGQENKVQFEGEAGMQPEVHSPLEERPATGLAKLLIDKGIAANKKSADFILIAIAIGFFILMILILVLGLYEPQPIPTQRFPAEELKS